MGVKGGSDSQGESLSASPPPHYKCSPLTQLVDSNGMDVFSKYFRRLVSGNAFQIFPTSSNKTAENAGNYPILVEEMRKVIRDPGQALKIAEAIDGSDGDIFRDFDLITFVEHFKLDPIAQSAIGFAFKRCTRNDLRIKGERKLTSPYRRMRRSNCQVKSRCPAQANQHRRPAKSCPASGLQ